MAGIGTVVNVAAIVAGGIVGIFIKKGLPDRFKNIIMQGVGLSVFIIGIAGVLQGMYKVVEGDRLDSQFVMVMIFSIIIGGIAGELLNIENKLEKLGLWAQKRFSKNGHGFAEGFVSASILYCVGAMAIVGSLEDGLMGNPATLFAKSILDGVISIIFASTMGIGVAFSSVSVLLYQGGITLAASFVKPYLVDIVITQMSLVGSVLIMGIGVNILDIKKIKVGNMLPAVFIPLVFFIVARLFTR